MNSRKKLKLQEVQMNQEAEARINSTLYKLSRDLEQTLTLVKVVNQRLIGQQGEIEKIKQQTEDIEEYIRRTGERSSKEHQHLKKTIRREAQGVRKQVIDLNVDLIRHTQEIDALSTVMVSIREELREDEHRT